MCLKHQEESSVDIEDRRHSVRMVLLLPGDHLENLLYSPDNGHLHLLGLQPWSCCLWLPG